MLTFHWFGKNVHVDARRYLLQTERLGLRPFSGDDLAVMAELFRNPGFMRFSGSTLYSCEQTAAFLEKVMNWDRTGQPSEFAVIVCQTDQLIGYCGFLHQEVDGQPEIEIAYRLHPDFWNRGLAAEAAHAVRDHAFRDLKLPRVIFLIHPDNAASRRVTEKNGMRLEKETVFRGFPAQVFAITRDEWLEKTR